jgi:hypothetical protein
MKAFGKKKPKKPSFWKKHVKPVVTTALETTKVAIPVAATIAGGYGFKKLLEKK